MATTINRRAALVGALRALPALAGGASGAFLGNAVLAASDGADGDLRLEALRSQWRLASAAFARASDALAEAEESCEPIPSPPYRLGFDEGGFCQGYGRLLCDLSHGNIAELRDAIARGKGAVGGDDESIWLRERASRAARTLKKIEDCLVVRSRREDALGLTALEAEADRLYNLREDVGDEIMAAPARTMRALVIQAEVALKTSAGIDSDEPRTILQRIVDFCASSPTPIGA